MLRAALIAALAICAWGAPARGADPKAEVRAIRVAEAPVIDGVVDDAVWQRAGVATDFTQVVPVEGARPSERTEFYFLYDDRNLYVGFRCFDDDPEGVIARTRLRDEDQDSGKSIQAFGLHVPLPSSGRTNRSNGILFSIPITRLAIRQS